MNMFTAIGLVIIILFIIYSIYVGRKAREIERIETAKRNQEERNRINKKRHHERMKSQLLESLKSWSKEFNRENKQELISFFDKEKARHGENNICSFFCSEAIRIIQYQEAFGNSSIDRGMKRIEEESYHLRRNSFEWLLSKMKSRFKIESFTTLTATPAERVLRAIDTPTSVTTVIKLIDEFDKWKDETRIENERLRQEEIERIRKSRIADIKEQEKRNENERKKRERAERIKLSRKTFSIDDPEWNSNGDYKIEGEDYMSIWKYKVNNGISPNTNNSNGSDSRRLVAQGVQTYKSIPDHGDFGKVQLFRIEDLDDFYS